MEYGIKEIVLDEIKEIARKYDISKVILFGSRARGDYWRASDIDLAVSGGEVTKFALEIEDNTSTLLQYDVVELDKNISSDLQNEIEKDGVILYEKI